MAVYRPGLSSRSSPGWPPIRRPPRPGLRGPACRGSLGCSMGRRDCAGWPRSGLSTRAKGNAPTRVAREPASQKYRHARIASRLIGVLMMMASDRLARDWSCQGAWSGSARRARAKARGRRSVTFAMISRAGRKCLSFGLRKGRSGRISGSQFLDLLLAIRQRGASSIAIGCHHGQKRLVAFAAGLLCVGGHGIDFGFALASEGVGGDRRRRAGTT